MISISFTLRFGIYHALMKIMGTYPGSFGCQELMILPFSCDLAEQALGHGTCPDFLSNSTGWFRRKSSLRIVVKCVD